MWTGEILICDTFVVLNECTIRHEMVKLLKSRSYIIVPYRHVPRQSAVVEEWRMFVDMIIRT